MLENMKAFRMVVECQGFRAAAIAMKLSPAMISRRIEKLECEVNAQLIKRNSRRISLTSAGATFLPEHRENSARISALAACKSVRATRCIAVWLIATSTAAVCRSLMLH